jgi:hypothetical protein
MLNSFVFAADLAKDVRRKRYIAYYTCDSLEELKQNIVEKLGDVLEAYAVDTTAKKVFFSMVEGGKKPKFFRGLEGLLLTKLGPWDYRKDISVFQEENPNFIYTILQPKTRKVKVDQNQVPHFSSTQQMENIMDGEVSVNEMVQFLWSGKSKIHLFKWLMEKKASFKTMHEYYQHENMLAKLDDDIWKCGDPNRQISSETIESMPNASEVDDENRENMTEMSVVSEVKSKASGSSKSKKTGKVDYFPNIPLQRHTNDEYQDIINDILDLFENSSIATKKLKKFLDLKKLSETLNLYKLVKIWACVDNDSYTTYVKDYKPANSDLEKASLLTEILKIHFDKATKAKFCALESKYGLATEKS